MIKAIFFDIDGTLVSFNTHTIPQSTIDALSLLRNKGIKIFIATGRPYMAIDNLGDLVFDGFITLNGGYCMTSDKKVIYKNSIPSEDIRSLVDYLDKNTTFPCMVVTESRISANYTDSKVMEILKLIKFMTPPIKDIREIINEEVFQLIAFFDSQQEKHLMGHVLPGCDSTRWNPLFTDVVAKGNSKQVGIDKILEHYGLDLSDTMSFGDGGNDISMLRHTAISVAMGNAADDVKQAASYVTDSVDDDGVWNALKHFGVI